MNSSSNEFCRLCLRFDANVSVFAHDSSHFGNLSAKIFECISIQISIDDYLPLTICNSCEKNVNNWCDFKSVCDRTQRTLFLWLNKLSSGTKEEIQRGLKEQAKKRGFELGYFRNADHWNSLSSVEPKKYSYAPLPKKKRDLDRNSLREGLYKPAGSNENLVKRIRIESTHSLVSQPTASKQVFLKNGTSSQNSVSPVLPSKDVQQADSTKSAEQVNEVQSSDNTGEELSPGQEVEASSMVISGGGGTEGTELSEESPVSTAKTPPLLPAPQPTNPEPAPSQDLVQPSPDDSPPASITQSESENLPSGSDNAGNQLASDRPDSEDQSADVQASESQPVASEEQDRDNQPAGGVGTDSENQITDSSPLQLMSKDQNVASSEISVSESQPPGFSNPQQVEPAQDVVSMAPEEENHPAESTPLKLRDLLTTGLDTPSGEQPAWCSTPQQPPVQPGLEGAVGEDPVEESTAARYTEESAYEEDDHDYDEAPERPPSPAYSTYSCQPSYPLWNPQIDYGNVRVKDEPLSDPEDYLGETMDLPVTIKQEPLDFNETRDEASMSVASTSSSRRRNSMAQCLTCQQKFKNQDSLKRHFNTEIHKKMTNLISDGQRVSRQTRNYWAKKIRSDAKAKSSGPSYLRDRTRAGSQPPPTSTASHEVPLAEISLPSRSELLECTVCNVILRSRSLKVKHDNSLLHKNALAAHNASSEPIHPIVSREQVETYPATTYACPFASCNLSFFDGGQLIVHMHSHGISLPMTEVDKQVKLGQQIQQQNQIQQQKQQSQVHQQKQHNQVHQQKQHNQLLQNQKNQEQQESNNLGITPSSSTNDETNVNVSSRICHCGRSFNSYVGLSNHLRYCKTETKKVEENKCEEVCSVCLTTVRNRRCLVYHIKTYHPGHPVPLPPSKEIKQLPKVPVASTATTMFKCPSCTRTFRSRLFLNIHHTKAHKKSRKKRFTCKICKHNFMRPQALISHLRIHKTKSEEFPCDKCQQVFPSKALAEQHMNKECSLKIKIFSCNDCGHSYNTQESLDAHKSEFHPETSTPADVTTDNLNLSETCCDICNKEYSSLANMKRHQKLHFADSMKRTFTCSECEDTFPNLITRSCHPCPGKPIIAKIEASSNCAPPTESVNAFDSGNFVSPKNKNDHSCKYCGTRFLERRYLLNHWKRNCKMVPQIFCENCNTQRLPWHSDKKPCRVCGVKPSLSTAERDRVSSPSAPVTPSTGAHLPVAPPSLHRCPLGKRTFLTQKAMLHHATSCSGDCKDQPVKCKYCRKSFVSPKVYLIHKPCPNLTIDGKFPCKFCPGLYKSRNSCTAHMRSRHNWSINKQMLELQQEDGDSKQVEFETPTVQTSTDSVSKLPALAGSANNDSGGLLKCEVCPTEFDSYVGVYEHMKFFHKLCTADCTFCGENIFRRQLYSHGYSCIKNQLVNETMLECVSCNNEFLNNDDDDTISLKLQEHLVNCYRLSYNKGDRFSRCKEKFLCIKCCVLFSSKSSLTNHMEKRHGIIHSPTRRTKKNPKVMNTVKKEDNGILLQSVESAEVVKREDCVDAETVEPTPEPTPEPVPQRIYKCSRCSKPFKHYKSMRAHHQMFHTFNCRKKKKIVKVKPTQSLQCKFCLRQFLSESKLLNHEKVHGIVQETVRKEALEDIPPDAEAGHSSYNEVAIVPNDVSVDVDHSASTEQMV